ncbi:MAG: hypothetical protein AABZ60_21415 [Planctomycetota bacterium]
MQWNLFLGLWIFFIGCEFSQEKTPETATVITDEEYTEHLSQLKKKLPHSGFTIIQEKPFMVIGDESPQKVQSRAIQTIRWATQKLKASYFAKDPSLINDIWLFKDKISYEKHTLQLFGYKPHTPFGFYSESERSLIMNIGTGGGTLVHEMVHVFMAGNFPECPSWFNEALASLYEQCQEKEGEINGLTNWRLEGLQKAIKSKSVPSFKILCSTTQQEFYNKDPGTNYSQGRYLCYYLQEQGLLKKYYQEFVAHQKEDPSGYETLKKILAVDDMDAFQKKWEEFSLQLQFP